MMHASMLWVATLGICGLVLSGCGGEDEPTPAPAPAPGPAYSPANVSQAWDNHFEAFGAGVTAGAADGDAKTAALDKIMLDYDAKSIVRVYNDAMITLPNDKPEVYTGVAEIRGMFNQLFTDLAGCTAKTDSNYLQAPLALPEENPNGQVFLVWQCQLAGFNYATDTFIMNGVKVAGQNIVVTKVARPSFASFQKPTGQQVQVARISQAYNPTSVQMAWDNHFSAFGAKDVSKIMLDYDATSQVQVWEWAYNNNTVYTGVDEIMGLFTNLFETIGANMVNAPVVEVVERDVEKSVFLVWNSPGAGISKATDTFIFGDDFKIKKQNIVSVTTAPTVSEAAVVV